MKRRTKIVCTLGPATSDPGRIRALVEAGINVARINCSHGDWDSRSAMIQAVREACAGRPSPVGILVDLQGPKFRIGPVTGDVMEVTAGQNLSVTHRTGEGDLDIAGEEIWAAMESGDRLLLGDGDVELRLTRETLGSFAAEVLTSGKIKSRQGVTLVGKSFETEALTEKDLLDLQEAAKVQADFVALSYVRRASDLRELRRVLDRMNYRPMLCAKIETVDAVREIDEILKVADVVMVARGDLGLQMAIEDVPLAQKLIIKKANGAGKPVITATQMLESMVQAARPTRAEATDVANAILDGTDAVMLSGETATGAYPLETVRMMARIAEAAEQQYPYDEHYARVAGDRESTSAVAEAAVQLSHTLGAEAILTTSSSGHTPRMVSKFRPRMPVLCAAWSERTYRQMSVVWGVEAILVALPEIGDDVIPLAIDAFMREGMLRVDHRVVITAGIPAGLPGHTNLILVETVR